MKNTTLVFSSLLMLMCNASCKEGWTTEYRQMYHEACMTGGDALRIASDHREAYCQCSLEKVMSIYPNMEDAISNKDSTQMNAAVQSCTQEAMAK